MDIAKKYRTFLICVIFVIKAKINVVHIFVNLWNTQRADLILHGFAMFYVELVRMPKWKTKDKLYLRLCN